MTSRKSPKKTGASTSRRPDVGYGRPPIQHRFKPGQSGNPKGRPKGRKNADTILRDILERKVQMRVNGQIKRISFLEAMLLRFAEDALKGNTKTAAFLLARYQQDSGALTPDAELSPDDEKLINDFLEQSLKRDSRK